MPKPIMVTGSEENFYQELVSIVSLDLERYIMNKVILMGRLTRDPEVRYSSGANAMAVARFTLAVDRRFRRDGEASADFINCVSFGKTAEFAEKYFRQGLKVLVTGRIQTGSYTNRDGQKVYTTDVVVEDQEFAESKASSDNHQGNGYQGNNQNSNYQNNNFQNNSYQDNGYQGGGYQNNFGGYNGRNNASAAPSSNVSADGFMNIPDGIDEELPFN